MRKKQNAQVVTEKKPNPEDKQSEPNLPVSVPDASESDKSSRLPFDISGIPKDKIAMAEGFGIPITQILNWATSITARLDALETTLPKMLGEELQKAIDKAKTQPPKMEMMPIPSQVSHDKIPSWLEGFMTALPSLTQQQPQNTMLNDLAMESLKADIDLSKTLKGALVSTIGTKASHVIVDKVLPE